MKWVILDRDGVINEDSDDFIKSPEEFKIIDGSLEGMSALNHAGYNIVIITNQSGVGRGLFSIDTLNAIHQKLLAECQRHMIQIDAIFFCPHHPDDGCDCRKPKPGLFLDMAERTGANLKETFAIGDSWRDIEAAKTAQARPILVKTGKGQNTTAAHKQEIEKQSIPVFANLHEAAQAIINKSIDI